MVSVSRETPDETERRLRQVIAAADLVIHEGMWYFKELPLTPPPSLSSSVLAAIRDAESWSLLMSAADAPRDVERFGVFSFHFSPDIDNSGFVGWLATHLKRELGTRVVVVCGSNQRRGGIYDYWGCPAPLFSEVVDVVGSLRASGG